LTRPQPSLAVQAVKIAKAMGADVTVISTSDQKREEALGHLGAQHFLISRDEAAMKVRGASFLQVVMLDHAATCPSVGAGPDRQQGCFISRALL